jgi:hypothetical protein
MPTAPAWSRGYALPTARQVVATGLQLAVDANAAIRRASIYIGLLALAAMGPAILVLLLAIARLLGDPGLIDLLVDDPSSAMFERPELIGPLLAIYALVVTGFILLLAISIDAQGMAISILGGRASEQPMRLWEAIGRARQVFWRLVGAAIVVGVASSVVAFVVTVPFVRVGDSNEGLGFIGSMIGALAVTPLAFAATGIVLGDVGVTEALRRSGTLFRARPRIALVVTLFTLATSALETFALGAGADAAVRVGALMHLGLDQGIVPLVLTALLVLAFIVAFGSLTFTIAAIVAAPQVAAFLGLTYYSGGLDRARTPGDARPPGFRWVTLPMLVAMIGLLLLALIELPEVVGLQL